MNSPAPHQFSHAHAHPHSTSGTARSQVSTAGWWLVKLVILFGALFAQCLASQKVTQLTDYSFNQPSHHTQILSNNSEYYRNLIEDDIFTKKFRAFSKQLTKSFDATTTTEEFFSVPNTSLAIDLHSRRDWNFTQVNLANSHLFYIRTKFSCSMPRAKLVKVDQFHASPSKQYVPRCTVLHRCDEESGCCEDITHRCQPSKTELVDLYFHVIRSDIKNNITGGSAVGIERLTFLNHTKCECKPINYMPRTVTIRPPMRFAKQSHHHHHHSEGHHKCRHVIKCPEPFVQRFRESDQRCVCDCLSPITRTDGNAKLNSHKQCLEIQSGIANLGQFGARCVSTGECAEPICGLALHFSHHEARCLADSQIRMRHSHSHSHSHTRNHLHHRQPHHGDHHHHSTTPARDFQAGQTHWNGA